MIHQLVEKILYTFFGLFLFALLGMAGVYWTLSSDLPQLPEHLENINLSLPTEIYSADGERLKVLGERHPVSGEDISPYFLKAIIAVEDAGFYRHRGLDHVALLRALVTNLRERSIRQGGSTITQQLSKNLFFSFERNWVRKIKELLVALQLEATFSKDQILQAYCNQIYFGSGAYGVEEAAQVYFGKRARDLSLLQAALLAGLPNSPNKANPFINLDRAMRRAEYVLRRMAGEKLISPLERRNALESPLELKTLRVQSDPGFYFVDHILEKLEEDYGRELVHFGGLRIYTTLDHRFQEFAMKAAQSHLEALDDQVRKSAESRDQPLQVALVAIENKSGAVKAMLGGRDYSQSQFNRATSSNRLPGSSFKPFVYLTAMETLGFSPITVIADEPITIEIPGTDPWEPKNFGEEFAGSIILKKALMRSINIVSAKLMEQVTPQRVIKTARNFGIKSPLGNHMSLALGTSGVSPLEMASAYSVIANLGVYNEPYTIQRIEDFHGNPLYEHFFYGIQRFSQKSMYPLLDMMRGVVEGGTGHVVRRMGFDHPAAGKTGTTNDFKDAWFDGFTKDYSVSVWVGYDNNEPMIGKSGKGFTGAGAAAPIWVFFMQKLLQGKSKVNFPVPEGIRFVTVDAHTGSKPFESTVETLRVALPEEIELNPVPQPEPQPEPELSESQARLPFPSGESSE